MSDTSRYLPAQTYDNNGGSGLTQKEAHGAATGEAIERYCGGFYDTDAMVFGTASSLRSEYDLSSPAEFALFHPTQSIKFAHFDDDTPLMWVWGHSLVHHKPVLVPACLVYMPYLPNFCDKGEEIIAPAVSTGMACGYSYAETIIKGIFEIVERDAFMITWMNRLPAPKVDISTNDGLYELFCDRFRRDGLTYTLIDTTTDIPFPTFHCILIDEMRTPQMINVGGATSLDPTVAATKALIEVVQTREWAKYLGRGSKTFNFDPTFSSIESFEDHVALYAYGDMMHAVEFLLTSDVRRENTVWENKTSGDVRRDLKYVLNVLTRKNLDVIVVDLTTPDVADCGYCVTKTLIPSLQPLHADHQEPFLGGARLYTTPKVLGYSQNETRLDGLNPYPHPFP